MESNLDNRPKHGELTPSISVVVLQFEKKTMGERSTNVQNSAGLQAFIWGWGEEGQLGLGDDR